MHLACTQTFPEPQASLLALLCCPLTGCNLLVLPLSRLLGLPESSPTGRLVQGTLNFITPLLSLSHQTFHIFYDRMGLPSRMFDLPESFPTRRIVQRTLNLIVESFMLAQYEDLLQGSNKSVKT